MKFLPYGSISMVLATGLPFSSNYVEEPAKFVLLQEAADLKVLLWWLHVLELMLALPLQGALCLDGSPPGYFFRPGKDSGSNKWLLHLMGGGWCFLGTEECYNRSFTIYGSSANWSSSFDFHGALSSNMETNPTFYNWNMVFLMYCDGASFAGDR